MKRLTPDKLNKLAAIKVKAIVRDSFDILNLMDNLVYVPDLDAPAATDGKAVFFGDKLFSYSVDDIYFILNHELDHIYYRHMDRFERTTDSQLHYLRNIATDLIINEILETKDGLKTPEGGITRAYVSNQLKKKIQGRTSEEVLAEILEVIEENKKNSSNSSCSNGSCSNSSDSDESSDSSNSSDSDDSSDSSDSSDDALDQILGSKAKGYKDKIDKEESSQNQIKQAKETLTEEELEKIDEAAKRIASKLAVDAREIAEVQRNFKPEKIDWKKMLKRFLGTNLKRAETRNIRRPSVRYKEVVPSNVVIPSNQGYIKTPKIGVFLDISGSMTPIIQNVRQVVVEAETYFKKYKSTYYEFTTEIYELSRKDFYASTKASGGTDLIKVLNMYSNNNQLELGVIFTDSEDDMKRLQPVLDNIKKPLLLITDNKDVKTQNRKVTVVLTDFK